MNILNDEITHAVDGIGGGTYVLTANVNFSSLTFGVQFGKVDFNNTAAIGFGTGVTLNGSPTWTGTVTLVGSIVVGAISITGTGPTTLALASGGHITAGTGATIDLNSGGTFTAAVGSTTTFNNDPVFSSGHIVTFDGTEHVTGTMIVSGSGQIIIDTGTQLLVNEDLNVAGSLTALNGSNVSIDSGGSLIVQSGGNFSILSGSVVSFEGLINLTGVIAPSSAGRIRKRVNRPNGTINVTSNSVAADFFHYSGLTAPRDFVLTATGAATGDVVEISILGVGNTNQLSVIDDVAALIIGLSNQAGAPISAKFYFDGSAWILFMYDIFD